MDFLKDKTAWVTGASRGIGRAIAIALARAGATVCLGARSEEDLQQVAEILAAEDRVAHPIALDVSRWEAVEAFANAAVEKAGPPSIVVNNAGYGLFRDFDAMTPAEFDQQLDVTLKGPWYVSRAAVEYMKQLGGGDIINISSIAGTHAFKRGTAYCAAKAGLNSMSECMMLELRELDIRVVTIAPGSVQTRFHGDALPNANPRNQDWMLEPERIAEAVLHALQAPRETLVNYYEVRPLKPVK